MKKKLAIGLIIVIALMGFIYYQYTRSFSYQYTAGRQAEEKKDYYDATVHYRQALKKNSSDTRTLFAIANVYYKMGSQKQLAVSYLLKAVKIDGSYTRAFRLLLQIYESDGAYDRMEKAQQYATSKEAKAIFKDYLIRPPVFSVTGGTYDDDIILTLTPPEGEDDYQIFYTTDGKAPNGVNGHLYDGTIYLTEGKTKVRAVCRNANGKFGEVESHTYTIRYKAPSEPTADPDGGEFTEEKKVTLTADEGAIIYYSWSKKSRTPDTSDKVYTEPVKVPEGYNVLSAIAVDRHGKKSKVYHMGFSYYPDK